MNVRLQAPGSPRSELWSGIKRIVITEDELNMYDSASLDVDPIMHAILHGEVHFDVDSQGGQDADGMGDHL
jgi:hypothetical protein